MGIGEKHKSETFVEGKNEGANDNEIMRWSGMSGRSDRRYDMKISGNFRGYGAYS